MVTSLRREQLIGAHLREKGQSQNLPGDHVLTSLKDIELIVKGSKVHGKGLMWKGMRAMLSSAWKKYNGIPFHKVVGRCDPFDCIWLLWHDPEHIQCLFHSVHELSWSRVCFWWDFENTDSWPMWSRTCTLHAHLRIYLTCPWSVVYLVAHREWKVCYFCNNNCRPDVAFLCIFLNYSIKTVVQRYKNARSGRPVCRPGCMCMAENRHVLLTPKNADCYRSPPSGRMTKLNSILSSLLPQYRLLRERNWMNCCGI